jgi:general secretion pathway protein D
VVRFLSRALLVGLALLGLQQRAAAAQPVALTSVAVAYGQGGATRAILTFDRNIPQYSIVSNDSQQIVIGFSATVRAQGAVAPSQLDGLLGSIDFKQNDTVLSVSLTGPAPIHITASPINSRTLALTITQTSKTATTRERVMQPTLARASSPDPDWRKTDFEVVRLKYADVSEIVGILTSTQDVRPNDNFNPQEPAFGSAGVNNYGNTGVSTSLFPGNGTQNAAADEQALGQSINEDIGIDRRLNAIILHGPPAHIARLKAIIAQLDVPVTSVVLETVFVELTETGAHNVGLDFNNSNSQIAVVTYNSGTFNPSNFGTDKGIVSASLQAAIYAQVKDGQGRIISKPRIAAQSGTSAKIVTGDALPILTAITLSGVNGVSQQVQYVNVGVTLQIAPRVSDNGDVTSHIFCEVSSVTGYSQGYPTISQREASTSATVKDGESFIIGGLSQENQLSTNNKVPGLGDIPLIGRLFNFDSGTSSKTDLYIVVTPHIVHGRDDAADDVLKKAP